MPGRAEQQRHDPLRPKRSPGFQWDWNVPVSPTEALDPWELNTDPGAKAMKRLFPRAVRFPFALRWLLERSASLGAISPLEALPFAAGEDLKMSQNEALRPPPAGAAFSRCLFLWPEALPPGGFNTRAGADDFKSTEALRSATPGLSWSGAGDVKTPALESRSGRKRFPLSGRGRRYSRRRLAGGSQWQAEAGRFQSRSASVGDELLSRWREALSRRPGRSAMLKILEFCHAHPDYRRRWQCHGD